MLGGWVRMLHPDDVKQHVDQWNQTLPRGKPFTVEYRARRADGAYRWHLGRVQPVRGADRKIAMWIAAHLDIEDRIEIEEALRESEARFRQLADAMPQIVWAARPDGRPDYFNRRWFDYTGFSPDEPFESILHPDDAAFTRHIWLDSVRTGEPYQIEYRFHDRINGGYRWHLGRAMPVRNDAGDIVRWFGTSTDIDSQKLTEEALRRANEAKDEFLGLVSHELKTPITTIFGNAEVLRMRADQLDAASRTAALEDIGSEAERLHRIVENLLVLARLDQGESVHVEPILIRRLVSKLIADHERRFPHRTVTFDAITDIIPILGEPTYVEQVLRNLLSNAEKYSPPDQTDRDHTTPHGQEGVGDLRARQRHRHRGGRGGEALHAVLPLAACGTADVRRGHRAGRVQAAHRGPGRPHVGPRTRPRRRRYRLRATNRDRRASGVTVRYIELD